MSYFFYIETYWAHQISALIKTTYEPLRTYTENYEIYAMLPKGYGLDRGLQRSLPASRFHNPELLQSDFITGQPIKLS